MRSSDSTSARLVIIKSTGSRSKIGFRAFSKKATGGWEWRRARPLGWREAYARRRRL
jgi:hypothetical protein